MSIPLYGAAFEVELEQTLLGIAQLSTVLHDHDVKVRELAGLNRINTVDTSQERLALVLRVFDMLDVGVEHV